MDDDTTTLVSELLQKLAELQHKVDEYSQDIAQQFKLYENEVLKDVPEEVSFKVEKAIANSLHNYPALKYGLERQHQLESQHQHHQQHHHYPSADSYLPLTTTATSPSTLSSTSPTHTHGIIPSNNVNRMARPGNRGSPPPALLPTAGSPDNGPNSPREREFALHGLFIPSYLPLLEGADRHSPAPTSSPFLPTVLENSNSDRDPNRDEGTPPRSLTPIAVARPDPVRRHTEDTLSSANSDESTSKVKRSALRRSSSSSTKTFSPRRVRFDVEGQEVLPTASPQARPSDHPIAPLGNTTDIPNDSYQIYAAEDDDLGLLGSSPPRPKKITSTDKLKALARNSTEDTSTWTVVGNFNSTDDDDDDELVMANLSRRKQGVTSQAPAPAMTQSPSPAAGAHLLNGARPPTHLRAPLHVAKANKDINVDEDELDDDLLSMPALTSFKGRKRFSPSESTTSAPEKMASQYHKFKRPATKSSDVYGFGDNDEEDPLFDLEDVSTKTSVNQGTTLNRNTKYLEEEEDEPEVPKSEPSAEETEGAQRSTPPGVAIAKPEAPMVTSSRSRAQSTSVGSFRGKPIHISSIRNQEVYEKAVAMGDFQSFIGSVDGRSGIDESTSYQPEAMRFAGTPRSLSERLMKDELEELRRKPGSASYSG